MSIHSHFRKIKNFIFDPKIRFSYLSRLGVFKKISDKKYLEMKYKRLMRKELNLSEPRTFNEKLQWLKIYDHNPQYSIMVDKYDAKKYVQERIGEQYIIPSYGVWDKFADIDFDKLPDRFVLKCTHNSGNVIICKDKSQLNLEKCQEILNKSLKRDYFESGREWPYKNVKPRIIAEKYMENVNGEEISDYKIQCFSGKADHILVCVDRFTETGVKYHYFDREWNYLPYCPYEGITKENINVKRPEKLEEMIKIAEKLSEGLPQLRVDLYLVNDQIYFGEMTFFTNSGFDRTITKEADMILGEKLKLFSTVN